MSCRDVTLCLLLTCVVSACAGDPFDDVSMVAPADRPALQKCLAAPDLPGNQWPTRAGKARCWLSLPQEPSLHDIAGTLGKPGGAAALDRQYAQILVAHHSDPLHRDLLFAAYQQFGTDEGRKIAADWIAKSPTSPYAQLAQGEAALAVASKARGSAFAAETSDAQFEGMAAQLRVAVPLLQSALQSEANLSPACVDLMRIGSMSSDESLRVPATRACMRIDPLSWHVNEQWLRDIDPRWGGSYDALDKAVAQIRLHVKDSPMLGSLLAKGIGRRAYLNYDSSDLTPIAPALDRAAQAAPDAFYLAKAGMAAEQAGDHHKALDYVSQALRFVPDDPRSLVDHAKVLRSMGDINGALRDARRAANQPDDDCGCHDYDEEATLFAALHQLADERTVLQKSIQSESDHGWALSTLCNTYIEPEFDREPAIACTKQLVDESPDDANALYTRALVLYVTHDPTASEVDAHFRKLANASDPDYPSKIQQLDDVRDHPPR